VTFGNLNFFSEERDCGPSFDLAYELHPSPQLIVPGLASRCLRVLAADKADD
jgi:hypothetical protein